MKNPRCNLHDKLEPCPKCAEETTGNKSASVTGLSCPHCGGKIKLVMEGKHYSNRHGRKVQFARGMCINNDPFKGEDRCLYKTTASELNKVKEHLNKRAR